MLVVAIDIGGTFTDLIGFDEAAGAFVQAKSLTTPAHLVQGIIDCLNKSGPRTDPCQRLYAYGSHLGWVVTKHSRG